MISFNIHDDAPIPDLEKNISRQHTEGGRLILYRRMWSAVIISITQDRIEHVAFQSSRVWPGLKHSLFTLFLGVWSPTGLFMIPCLLILNFSGGADVTGQYSSRSIDPHRSLLPDPGQGERDLKFAQWMFVTLGMIALVSLLFYIMRTDFTS